ncbi:hypothetical protein NMY22_g6408 [Coprinellus aureogranulatus]|nr:hypothetical protein NMY22_g6408 [Coprinellus aureogranulatus]
MIQFFSDNPQIPLRFVVTSRVENHIHRLLHSSEKVLLLDLVDRTSDSDIAVALDIAIANEKQSRLHKCDESWPSPNQKAKLLKHIGGSFIFMTTIVKYLFDPDSKDGLTPMRRLPIILSTNLADFDGLYQSILDKARHLSHFGEIVGTIALAQEPLSVVQIAELLELGTVDVVNVLLHLHAIMQIPGDDRSPITLWHTSLRDFLTSEKRSGPFFALPVHHQHLAYQRNLKDTSPQAAFRYWDRHSYHHLEKLLGSIGSDLSSNECDRASMIDLINSPTFRNGCTALEAASRAGKWGIVCKLVNVKADVNVHFKDDRSNIATALLAACYHEDFDMIYFLLDNGADPNISYPLADFFYGTPLVFASYIGDIKLITHLLIYSADPNLQGGFYGTALQAACCTGKLEVVNLLLEHGADLNLTGGRYGSALHACASLVRVDCARALLEHKADPDVRDIFGDTPLHNACRNGHTKVAELLLDFGVDPTIRNDDGKTALQVAIKEQENSTVQMLRRCGVHGISLSKPSTETGFYSRANRAALLLERSASCQWEATPQFIGLALRVLDTESQREDQIVRSAGDMASGGRTPLESSWAFAVESQHTEGTQTRSLHGRQITPEKKQRAGQGFPLSPVHPVGRPREVTDRETMRRRSSPGVSSKRWWVDGKKSIRKGDLDRRRTPMRIRIRFDSRLPLSPTLTVVPFLPHISPPGRHPPPCRVQPRRQSHRMDGHNLGSVRRKDGRPPRPAQRMQRYVYRPLPQVALSLTTIYTLRLPLHRILNLQTPPFNLRYHQPYLRFKPSTSISAPTALPETALPAAGHPANRRTEAQAEKRGRITGPSLSTPDHTPLKLYVYGICETPFRPPQALMEDEDDLRRAALRAVQALKSRRLRQSHIRDAHYEASHNVRRPSQLTEFSPTNGGPTHDGVPLPQRLDGLAAEQFRRVLLQIAHAPSSTRLSLDPPPSRHVHSRPAVPNCDYGEAFLNDYPSNITGFERAMKKLRIQLDHSSIRVRRRSLVSVGLDLILDLGMTGYFDTPHHAQEQSNSSTKYCTAKGKRSRVPGALRANAFLSSSIAMKSRRARSGAASPYSDYSEHMTGKRISGSLVGSLSAVYRNPGRLGEVVYCHTSLAWVPPEESHSQALDVREDTVIPLAEILPKTPLARVPFNAQWKSKFPKELRDALDKFEEDGKATPEYQQAMGYYWSHHLCTLDPMPQPIANGFGWVAKDPTVQMTMYGPYQFKCTGSLKNWSIVDELANIQVPVLVMNGAADGATDSTVAPFVEKIPDVKWVKFENSSHMAHFEEREKFMETVASFLYGAGV